MAFTPRTISEIQASIIAEKANHSELNDLNSPSQTSLWRLFTYIVAVAMSVFENILVVFQKDTDAKILAATSPSSPAYIKYQAINLFQYDATTPQVLILDNFAPTYSPVDATKRIITRCNAKTIGGGLVEIKVAKSEPPGPLSAPEISAATSFFDELLKPGVFFNLISDNSDKIYVAAEITYDGAYASVIATNVKNALNAYYKSLSTDVNFDGLLRVSDIENTIKDTAGVKDVKLTKVYGRQDSTVFASATVIFDLSLGANNQTYEMYAGYAEEENTAGYTLNDSLTFVAG
jgi:hypothetical protein